MVKKTEVQVPDIYPVAACAVRFVNEAGAACSGLRYSLRGEEYEADDQGYVATKDIRKDDAIEVLFESEIEFDESRFIEEIQPQVSELMLFSCLLNKAEGGEGPLTRGDDRSDYVTIVQKMLGALGYYLGESGEDNDGVDGVFGEWTRNAVLSFQSLSTDDKTGKPLTIDGLVGPVTIDVLARECVREGLLKSYVTRASQDEAMGLIWTAHRGMYQNHAVELKDVLGVKEELEKELEERYQTIVFRILASPVITVTFRETGEPATWLFVYLSPEDDAFALDQALITDADGVLRSKGDVELSRVLEWGQNYHLFYDWRPWSESDRKRLTAGDCQIVTIGQRTVLEPKSGDIDVTLQHIDGSPLARRPYLLHLPNGRTDEGVTGDDGRISKTRVDPGIVRLELGTSRVAIAPQGEDVPYQRAEPEPAPSREDIMGEGIGDVEGDLELSETDVAAMGEVEEGLKAIQAEERSEENLPTPDDDTFIVETSMLREARVILSRGRTSVIRVADTWRTLAGGDFRHWRLAPSDMLEDSDDSLTVLQKPGDRERLTPNVLEEA
jgi:hypothetical protein